MTTGIAQLMEVSGPNPWVRGLAQLLEGDEWHVLTGSLRPRATLQADVETDGHEAFSLDVEHRQSYARAVLRLARLVRNRRVSVVHSNSFDASAIAMVLRTLRVNRTWVYTYFHQPGFFDMAPMASWKRPLIKRLDRRIARRADAIVSPSLQVRRELEAMGISSAKIHDIPVGFDIETLIARADPERVASAQVELGLEGRFTALSVGRLSWEKDHVTSVRAWQRVVDQDPSALLLIAGPGPLGDELASLAADLGISDSVRILGNRPDVPALMRAADVIIHTALTESFGQVITEAMALGRPVVATATGVGAELIDGEEVLRIGMSDIDGLVRAIGRIRDEEGLATRLGQQAAELCKRRFGLEQNAAAFADLYRGLLNSRH